MHLPLPALAIFGGVFLTTPALAQSAQSASEQGKEAIPSLPHAMSLLTGDSGMAQRIRGAALRTAFAFADSSGDGVISVDEAHDLAARLLNGIDADGDRGVTLEELNAFVGGGRGADQPSD